MINTRRKGSPEPQSLLMVLAAAARGTALGEMIRRHLTTLGQRRGGEQDLQEPDRQLSARPPLSGSAALPADRRADAPAVRSACLLTGGANAPAVEVTVVRRPAHPE